jgi:hypothetical protein
MYYVYVSVRALAVMLAYVAIVRKDTKSLHGQVVEERRGIVGHD